MSDLPEICRRLLRALIAAPVAWMTPSQLASRVGGNPEIALDALADLDAGGWLDPWEMEDGLYVTLTPRAAEAFGVRLVPGGKSDTMRWASIDDPEPCPRVASRGQGEVDALDFLPDPAPGPDLEAEAAERAVGLAAVGTSPVSLGRLPRPSILLGSALTPWPGPRQAEGRACPGCGSAELTEKEYCLVCDRWGLDPLLLAAEGHPRPRRATPNAPRDAARPGDDAQAKAARMVRRRRKRAKQDAAARSKQANPAVVTVPPSDLARPATQPSG